jgi:hypothetical protein
MRMAVYKAGIKAGFWNDIDQIGVSDMMNYIFPKSGQIAYYNLIMEFMRKEHTMFSGGVFSLYKMPIQVEKELLDYLKKEAVDLAHLINDEGLYLESMDTIVTNHGFFTINIGTFSPNEIDTILRLCASHYRYSFKNKVKSFPYFD